MIQPVAVPNAMTRVHDALVFYCNGERVVVSGDQANLTLAQWLRHERHLVGTKIVCNEGDCGACSVLLGKPDESQSGLTYRTIDSCIAFLFQLNRTHVVTVEGLSVDGMLSPIQDAMVHCHGSQCGFCTPGFVATMHGMAESNQPFDPSSLRYGLSGNLCRCTGYVQIIEAGMSVDAAKVAKLAELYPDADMLKEFRSLGDAPTCVTTLPGHRIEIPTSMEQAIRLRAERPRSTIVSGATDYGVSHNHGRTEPGDILCLSSVESHRDVFIEDGNLIIGALASWVDIERFTKTALPSYHAILKRFGSPQIRQMGTLGGNIASGSPIADSVPAHLVLDSKIELASVRGTRVVAMNDFYVGYRQTVIQPDELITRVITPLPTDDERLTLYKISKRPDMDISTLTFAIWSRVESHSITAARIAVGGVGPTVMRMPAAEEFMIGKPWCDATFREAARIARGAVSPWTDVRGGRDYRVALTENLVVKSFHENNPVDTAP